MIKLNRDSEKQNIVIANPVLWDEAICDRLLRRQRNGLLVMTLGI